jgi:ribose 5-phosphate isomerase A
MNLKEQVAHQALEYVESGMVLGLGSGSTAAHFIDLLGARLQSGELGNIVGVATSRESESQARGWGIPLSALADQPRLDLTVDGADEVDPDLNLIKGLGRALLREKIVEIHTERLVIVVDESKLVRRLGRGPLPLDMVPFGWETQIRWLNSLGCRAELRLEEDGSPVVTDDGNYMALCHFPEGITDPHGLARALADRPGIVEHGLFLGMADEVLVSSTQGTRVLRRER